MLCMGNLQRAVGDLDKEGGIIEIKRKVYVGSVM